jgi:hypothetical protein
MAIDLRRFSPTPADIAAGFASQAAASRRQFGGPKTDTGEPCWSPPL